MLTRIEFAGLHQNECMFAGVRQLSRVVTRRYDDALRPLGITGSQLVLLTAIISEGGEARACSIGSNHDIEKSTLSRNLKRLVRIGCIEVGPPQGRKGATLTVTEKGHNIVQRAVEPWRTVQRKMLAATGLPAESFGKLALQCASV